MSELATNGATITLLIQFVMMLFILKGEAIPAVTFEARNGAGSPSSACYKGDLPEDFRENFTVCAFVRPKNTSPKSPASKNSPDKDGFEGILFTLRYDEVFIEASFKNKKLVVTNKRRKFSFDAPFEADVWRKICVHTDRMKNMVALVSDYYAGVQDVEKVLNNTETESNQFCVGSPSQNNFLGTITALTVTSWKEIDHISPEYYQPTDCSKLVPEDSFATLSDGWRIQGDAVMNDYDAITLCTEAFTPIAVKYFAGHKPHLDLCESINGRFMTEGELNGSLFWDISEVTDSCTSVSGKLFWYGGKSAGIALNTPCSAASTDGSSGTQPCVSELHCSVCILPANMLFTLYGEVFDIDRTFTLHSLPNGEFYLKGKDASEIRHNRSHWVMSCNLHNNRFYLKNSIFPIGRQEWESEKKNLTLTVTHCNNGQFSCNNSACIMRLFHCDGKEHCDDGDDERDCSIIILNKGYNYEETPATSGPHQKSISYTVKINSISDISTNEGTVTLDFSIIMSWVEPRLTFWNLKPMTQHFLCETIWIPSITSLAGYGSGRNFDLDVYDQKCEVRGGHPEKHIAITDHWMGEYLDGREYQIHMELYSRLTIPCNFKLNRYPFGIYICNISLYNLNGDDGMPFVESEMQKKVIQYDGSHDLLDFKLESINCETLLVKKRNPDKTHKTFIVITLNLRSLYDFHMLNSFAPSALMFLISFATFCFPIENFNERIMVSLTSLLVLAALFTQASSSSVKTPYYKLLDAWYAALIALCFMAVIMITCINALWVRRIPKSVAKIRPFGNSPCQSPRFLRAHSKAYICNAICLIILFVLFLILVVAYFCFAADLI